MRVFDRIDHENIESRETQLMLLACVAIFILTAGVAVLIYPAAFGHEVVISGPRMRLSFFAICGLSVLLSAYLVDRHFTIRRLRQRVIDEQKSSLEARRQTSADLLKTLPNMSSFQDRLPMEYRRAAGMDKNLSIVVVQIQSSRDCSTNEHIAQLGDAAKSVARKLREEDSLYMLHPEVLGVVLPDVSAMEATAVAARLSEGLADAAGVNNRFTHQVKIVNYPRDAASAIELEQSVRGFLPTSF